MNDASEATLSDLGVTVLGMGLMESFLQSIRIRRYRSVRKCVVQ